MKLFITVLFLIVLSSIQITNAQQDNERLRNTINKVHTGLENESRKPQWQQKYDAYMSGGNYFMNNNEYAKAIKSFNKALAIVPNSQEALVARNYCRQMLKEISKGSRR